MLTEDFTFQYTDTGVTLNTDVASNFVDITKVSGLDSAPLRTSEHDREDMDGGFIDAMYEKMRTVVLEGMVYGTETYLDTLKANFAPTLRAQPFYFLAPGVQERVLFVKSLGVKYDWEQLRRIGMSPIQFQMQAEDPAIYGALSSGAVDLSGTTTGFGFPFAFPSGFGGTSSYTSLLTLTNDGNRPTDATFTIVGPVIAPILKHDQTGNQLQFNINIASGDWLTVNLRNKTIRLNGVANRRGTLTVGSRWFMLTPGINTVRFLGSSTATATLQYTTRPAYR
jgi:hypothetical protein